MDRALQLTWMKIRMKDKRNSQATGLLIRAGKLTNIYVYFYVRTFFLRKS